MSVHSETLRRRSRPVESPRGYLEDYETSDEENEEVELPTEREELKIQAVNFLEEIFTLLRAPFALIASSLLVYWAVTTFSVAAGPAICDFPGSTPLEVCQTNSSGLAVHVIDNSDGFDFAPKHVEIQRLAITMVDVIHQINDQFQAFEGVIITLTVGDIPFESFHTGSLKAVRAARDNTGTWVNGIGLSLSWIILQYQNALHHLQDLKSKHSISPGQAQPSTKLETAQYNRTLWHLQEELSAIQYKLFERTSSVLHSLTAMEDSIELTLQIATGNLKPLKREKLGETRYWEWRLRGLKANSTVYSSKNHQLEWDSMMVSCAEFSSSITKAKKGIAEPYLIMLDAQRILGALKEQLARDIDIWAVVEGRDDNRVNYYLKTLMEGSLMLDEVHVEVRYQKRRAIASRQLYLDNLYKQ